ncbi:MAG: RsmD family RNA methyltransferase [Alphaproteobacteria bacterium]|nr:RsmD family RNA methyltransferase [Alphaproteobacteria bacterium]
MNSKLQIISGQYKGRKLNLPAGARPTQNRARIALFNMLESGIVDPYANMTIWDAFAGSGAFGIECLSRYSNATLLFTDVLNSSIKTVRDNLALLEIGDRASVIQADALSVISKYASTADIVFLDPPYSQYELGVAFVKTFAKYAKSGAIIIWEQDKEVFSLPDLNIWDILRDKTYGRARFLIMQKK